MNSNSACNCDLCQTDKEMEQLQRAIFGLAQTIMIDQSLEVSSKDNLLCDLPSSIIPFIPYFKRDKESERLQLALSQLTLREQYLEAISDNTSRKVMPFDPIQPTLFTESCVYDGMSIMSFQ